jgi:glycosyltransferase A (GT-A) superfamily protein (DUF2064 family)
LNSLVIFAKAPIKGQVKTRLKKDTDLSDDEILLLYRAFLKDIILTSEMAVSDRVILTCYPGGAMPVMKDLIASLYDGELPDKLILRPQVGRDFNKRFTNAVGEAFNVSSNVAVIGSDSPFIQPKVIKKSLDFLNKTGGMVLGPTNEGGVYLVGLSQPLDFTDVFTKGIELENLVALAEEKKMPLLLLDELTDIDVSSDLISFICNISAMEYAAKFNEFYPPKNTIKAIRDLGLEVVSTSGGERGRTFVKR